MPYAGSPSDFNAGRQGRPHDAGRQDPTRASARHLGRDWAVDTVQSKKGGAAMPVSTDRVLR